MLILYLRFARFDQERKSICIRIFSAVANNEEEKFKTMQYKISTGEEDFEALYRSELGYLRIISAANLETAMKVWSGVEQYQKSDLSSSWKCLLTISSFWKANGNKAHSLLDINDEFHHMKCVYSSVGAFGLKEPNYYASQFFDGTKVLPFESINFWKISQLSNKTARNSFWPPF